MNTTDLPSVMFVCVHHARSQMAAGVLTAMSGGAVEVHSTGTLPADQINPAAGAAMAEVGIDITAHHPDLLTDSDVGASDVVITMGCGDTCPYAPGVRYLDWQLDDPAGQGPRHRAPHPRRHTRARHPAPRRAHRPARSRHRLTMRCPGGSRGRQRSHGEAGVVDQRDAAGAVVSRLRCAMTALRSDPAMTAGALADLLNGKGHACSVRTAQRVKAQALPAISAPDSERPLAKRRDCGLCDGRTSAPAGSHG